MIGKFGAEFKGVSFGDGTSPANTLRKKVPVTFAQSTPDFSLGDAWVFRSSAQSENVFHYTIRVTYLGNEPRWYAKLESLRFIDTNGQVLVTSSLAYLDNVSGSAVSLFRIAKGEMAEAVGLESAFDVYSQIAAIEVGAVDPGSSSVSPGFKASIAATDLCKTNKGFVVSLVNRGAQTAGVSDLHRYLLSDGEGPVAVGFLQRLLPLDKSTGVKPNERSILAEEAVFSDGRADRATIFSVSYDGSIGSFESPPQASFSTAGNVALQIRRQAAQDFKREQFKLWYLFRSRRPPPGQANSTALQSHRGHYTGPIRPDRGRDGREPGRLRDLRCDGPPGLPQREPGDPHWTGTH